MLLKGPRIQMRMEDQTQGHAARNTTQNHTAGSTHLVKTTLSQDTCYTHTSDKAPAAGTKASVSLGTPLCGYHRASVATDSLHHWRRSSGQAPIIIRAQIMRVDEGDWAVTRDGGRVEPLPATALSLPC